MIVSDDIGHQCSSRQRQLARGVQGSGPPPPELPSGVHLKHKNPVRFFFVEGVGVGG